MYRTQPNGFTLIEILTVVGLILVLAALLFPIIGSAREQGNRSVCQGNLRQLSAGVQLYAQDYDGMYPGDPSNSEGWQRLVLAYVKDRNIFHCPTLGHAVPSFECDYRYGGDYDYNRTRLTLVEQGDQKSGSHESRFSDYASSLWVNYCTDANSIINRADYQSGSGESVAGSCGRSIYFVGVRHHNGATNWSFLDGHVKWLTPEQLAEVECHNPPLR